MIQMYDGVVNSIETVTTGAINATDTIINVLDETRIPEAPNILVLGSGASAETVKLVEKNGSVLTVERGLQGTAKSWASGTLVARNFTEYDHRAFKENIETLNTNQQETTTQLAQHELQQATQSDLGHVKLSENATVCTLVNGWTHVSTIEQLRYSKDFDGFVYMSGGITGGTTTIGTIITTLPVGYKPRHNTQLIVVRANDASIAAFNIGTNGEISIISNTATGVFRINVMFKAV